MEAFAKGVWRRRERRWRTNVYGELQTDRARLETISNRGIRPRPSIEKGLNVGGRKAKEKARV